jgi:16S rRNA (guanine527-N7)-methyltransferase
MAALRSRRELTSPNIMNDPAVALLVTTAASWGIALSPAQLGYFARYAQVLADWNAHTNLTAISTPEAIYRRHFLDSLSLVRFWGDPPARLIDLGSGGGFPGVPLKIVRPELRLTLVDSVAKKTAFLNHLVQELGLEGVQVRTARAEELGRDPAEREQYDVVTARALAELRVLAEYALPLARVGGRVLAPKGAAASAEATAAARAITLLGGAPAECLPVDLPGQDDAVVVVIRKVAPTDPRYPRAVGVPRRRPL